MTRSAVALVAALTLGLLASAYAVVDNWRGFHVLETRFATDPKAAKNTKSKHDWRAPEYAAREFRAIDLPFFLDSGRFRVRFETNRSRFKLSVFAVDCLKDVTLDGQRVFTRQGECQRCNVWDSRASVRCKAEPIELETSAGRHVLAISTQNFRTLDSNVLRDNKLLFLHYHNGAFWFRLLALACLAGLGWLAASWWRTRDVLALPKRSWPVLVRYRGVLLLLVFSTLLELVVARNFVTTDVSQSAMIYAENLVNRHSLHFAELGPDYRAAKYFGRSHMHKPPGVYYQYAILRELFGFTEAYYPNMARLPGLLGDWIIAFVIFAAVSAVRGDEEGTLAAGIYALSTGTFFTSGYVGRIDSLAIAFLMLALKNIERTRAALYLGMAIAWKQLALLCTPLLLTSKHRLRILLLAGVVAFVLCAPYFLDDPKLFIERLTMPQLDKNAGGLSWMINLHSWHVDDPAILEKWVAAGYVLLLCALPLFTRMNVWVAGAVTFGLFMAASKNVYEQYILWSMPFTLILAFTQRNVLALACFSLGATSMVLRNELHAFIEDDTKRYWAVLVGCSYFVLGAWLIVKQGNFAEAFLPQQLQAWRLRKASPPMPATPPVVDNNSAAQAEPPEAPAP